MATYSSLATVKIPAHSNNYDTGRNGKKVCKITVHHMAGNLSVETCGSIFQGAGRDASSNYGIGTDGRIAGYVAEENRSYCSSSRANDNEAITIEVANDGNADTNWHVSDKAWNALVKLCVDICKRYNFTLVYDGTANGSLTRHNMFTSTTCPGGYLQGRFDELAKTVNAQLSGSSSSNNSSNTSTSTITHKVVAGDTLSALANKYGTTVSNIVNANKSKHPTITKDYIVIGWTLNIPKNGSTSISTKTYSKGAKITLKNAALYASSTASSKAATKTGTFYLWDSEVINNRMRITNSKGNVGNASQITGWVKKADITLV